MASCITQKNGFIVKANANFVQVAKSCQLRTAATVAPSRRYLKNFVWKFGDISRLFPPTNTLFYYTYKMLKHTVKMSLFCSYMFRPNWTILRKNLLSLAKVTILWKQSVKVHRYMICGVVVANISGCDVCTACRVVWDCRRHTTRQAVHTSQPEICATTTPHSI